MLVNPPFVSLWRPNLGLSLLKARLREEGHPAKVLYLDHELASRLGESDYDWIQKDFSAMIGEWLFSGLHRGGGWDMRFLEGVPLERRQVLLDILPTLKDYLTFCLEAILPHQPKAVGCSSTFQQNQASLAILRVIKEANPEIVTVLGGANLEGEMGPPMLTFPWVDYVFSGEAEPAIGQLYQLITRHGANIPPDLLPDGVSSRQKTSPRRGRVENMDSLPYPDFQDCYQSLARYPEFSHIYPPLTLEGSRGCWWGQVQHCTFCGLNGQGMNYRAKSPSRMLQELFEMSERYRQKDIEMVDNIIAPGHLKEVLPELARQQRGLRFFWEVKANLKASQFELLRQAGVLWLQPGIESFSDHVLGLMHKGQRALQNLLVLKAARENGIRLSWNLLLGHPGERLDDIRAQKDLLLHLGHFQPPGNASQIRLDRFSPLWAANPDAPAHPVYSRLYDLPPELLQKVAYYFEFPVPSRHLLAIDSLRRRVEHWQSCWNSPEKRTLHFSGPQQVTDQRWPGKTRVHSLTRGQAELLQRCHHPARHRDVEGLVDPTELQALVGAGLCFTDESQILSLVLKDPAERLPAYF